jgi:hypothetical protein
MFEPEGAGVGDAGRESNRHCHLECALRPSRYLRRSAEPMGFVCAASSSWPVHSGFALHLLVGKHATQYKEFTMLGLWQTTEVKEYERGLLYAKGRFLRLAEPGAYRTWRWQSRRIERIDLRETSHSVDGQEILTSDKIGVRIALIAQFRVTDPVAALHQVENYQSQLHQDLQLTLREIVTGRTLEELLKDRDALSSQLQAAVASRAATYGIALSRVGVKDIVLPANVRAVFMQEVEADLKGRASLVAARHEVAAARARANIAKMLQDNPELIQLQLIEALTTLAGKPGNVIVVPGLDGLLGGRRETTSAKPIPAPEHK